MGVNLMPNSLSMRKILDLKTQVLGGNLSDVYKFLSENGYSYAGWARGLAEINNTTGTALMGVGLIDCNNLSQARLLNIKADVTWRYLNSMENFCSVTNGTNMRADITSSEVLSLYENILTKHNLTIENWSLHAPFKIIKKLEGEETLEAYWSYMRDENANGPEEGIGANLVTLAYMHKQSKSNDFRVNICAHNWLFRLPSICAPKQIESAFNNLWETASEKMRSGIKRMIHMLKFDDVKKNKYFSCK